MRSLLSVAVAVLRRPALWLEALRALPAFARRDWWRRAPFLPLPDPTYLKWRISTAYGASDAPVDADDVVAYLVWRRHIRT